MLLERITHFVGSHSRSHHGGIKRVKVEYSQRGGLRYSQMKAYYEWIREKSRAGNMFIKSGDMEWETLHPHLLKVWPHETRAGLKLADTVAGAFFQACDNLDSGPCNSSLAERLSDRMARVPDRMSGQAAGYGVKLIPNFRTAKLSSDQERFFAFTAIRNSGGHRPRLLLRPFRSPRSGDRPVGCQERTLGQGCSACPTKIRTLGFRGSSPVCALF